MTRLLPTLRIELESTPESVALIRATILKLVQACGLPDGLTDDLVIAVSEACNNVVLHAYPGSPGQMVVSLKVGEGSVEAEVTDFGRGARTLVSSSTGSGGSSSGGSSPGSSSPGSSSPGGSSSGGSSSGGPEIAGDGLGLGVGLIHAAASWARFESRPGGGMTVRMSFERPAGPLPAVRLTAPTLAKPRAAARHPQRRAFVYASHGSRRSLPGSA